MTVSHANCVNATCLYSDCGIAYVLFKTFPQQRWLNHLTCKGLVGFFLANKIRQTHVQDVNIGLLLGHCL